MDISAILLNSKNTVIVCKSLEYEAVKAELEAYFETNTISRIFTGDKAFDENGYMAADLEKHLKDGYYYQIAVPKINWYANVNKIIKEMEKFCPKVVAILPDCPNYGALFLNVINYNSFKLISNNKFNVGEKVVAPLKYPDEDGYFGMSEITGVIEKDDKECMYVLKNCIQVGKYSWIGYHEEKTFNEGFSERFSPAPEHSLYRVGDKHNYRYCGKEYELIQLSHCLDLDV